jgi:hypothetical protein
MQTATRSTIPCQPDRASHSYQSAPLRDVHSSMKRETVGQRLRRLIFCLAAKHSTLHGFAIELCSLQWRSEFQSRLHDRRLMMEYGPAVEMAPSGHLVPNRRTHARIRDIETFLTTCPKATLFERWVFLQAWNMGERFALHTADTQEMGEDSQS